jgi:hypothetical protein
VLTLLAVPVAYSWLDHVSLEFRRRFQQRGRRAEVTNAALHTTSDTTAEVGK